MRARLFFLALVSASLACQTLFPQATPTPFPPTNTPIVSSPATPPPVQPTPTFEVTPTPQPEALPPILIPEVRACDYIPEVSVPAVMPDLPRPTEAPLELPPPTPSAVDATLTEQQLKTYRALWEVVNENYVYADFNGLDWAAIGEKYQALIEAGLTEDDFYYAMNLMLWELGDNHSFYESPDEVAATDATFAGDTAYVGMGAVISPIPDSDQAVVIYTFPDSPARNGGLQAHDTIVTINGLAPVDADGYLDDAVIRGPEGSTAALVIQRPGQAEPFEITLTRGRIHSALPVEYCAVRGTRIGYIFIPGLDDETVGDQVRTALEAFTASGPLEGVILDNRQNGGGADTVVEEILGFFVDGKMGAFVGHRYSQSLTIRAEAIGNSQSAPLVVLVDVDTASFGEIMSGILQNEGRATIVGQTTLGNVETLWGFDLDDGSRAWIAAQTFRPNNLEAGVWEETGIVPEVFQPTRWDLFNEANDPALASAVQLLITNTP
jgi:C-terminal peptidase prc